MSQLNSDQEIKNLWIELSKMEGRVNKNSQTNIELAILKSEEKIKGNSDRAYAIKLIEKILFGILALLGAGTIAYLIPLVFKFAGK